MPPEPPSNSVPLIGPISDEMFNQYVQRWQNWQRPVRLMLTLDFGKSDIIEIIKQSAIRVNMKAGSQRLLSMKPGACLLEIHK